MRIAINCRAYLKKNYTGIGRYAYNLVQHLSQIDSENDYVLYAQKKFFDSMKFKPHQAQKTIFLKFEQ